MSLTSQLHTAFTRVATEVKLRGVPAGGTAGQLVAKASAVDHDTEWADAPGDSLILKMPGGWEGAAWSSSVTYNPGDVVLMNYDTFDEGSGYDGTGTRLWIATTVNTNAPPSITGSTYSADWLLLFDFGLLSSQVLTGLGTKMPRYPVPTVVTASNYAVSGANSGSIIRMDSAGAQTVTVSSSGSTGTTVVVQRVGVGSVTVVASGVTVQGTGSLVLRAQNSIVILRKVSSTIWTLAGDVESAASDTVAGVVELATQVEAFTGTDSTRAVTPSGLQYTLDNTVASEVYAGRVELATTAEAVTGTDTARAVTPVGVKAAIDASHAIQPALDYVRAALAASTLRPVYVIVLGDSYIEGSDATRQSLWYTSRLASAFQAAYPCGGPAETPTLRLVDGYSAPRTTPGVHVLNGGIGATDSSNYLTSTTAGYINTVAPKIVVHVIGTNDLVADRSKAGYKSNLIAKMALITTPNVIHILVHGALRPDVLYANPIRWGEYRDALDELAAATPATVASIDISAPFFAANATDGADPLDLFTDGGFHPNDAGMALMSAETCRLLGVPGSVPRDWIAMDTFTRPNIASFAGTRVEGWQTWTALGTAVYSVASGKAAPTTVGLIVMDALRPDVHVAADVTMSGTGDLAGIAARCSDVSNYLKIVLSSTQTVLYKVVAGTSTVLAWVARPHTAGIEYQLRVVLLGNTIIVYVNGRVDLTYTLTGGDATTFETWTKVGLCSSGTTAMKFDNFGVRPA